MEGMDQRRQRKMSNFREAVLVNFLRSKTLSDELRSRIDQRLHQEFPTFKTPDHPPYSLMIQTAIAKLREEGGSTIEAISGFIKKEYEGLPWGHESFLSHHLRKLCGQGEIVLTGYGRYILLGNKTSDFGDEHDRDQIEEPWRKMHGGSCSSGGDQYSYQAEEEESKVTGEEIQSSESDFQEQLGKTEALKLRIKFKTSKMIQ
ncbi:hypothetical protein HS088_TW02G00863 [Tripterygium wilfordii]|uniref:H15 domain-containing protein n=1 Tax=Tripterygium wilfordii TaxID=458696 RepID=A0A7J7E077_TRIWF|nr:uncharacterized protein LOC119980693 [Tripterygium wilfordii]KAF5751844.1 hypothetical protein HS088_TW02G00863 [Tripterygium wilfordii]